MTKYSTVREYQPYFEIISQDLGIPADLFIDFKFVPRFGASGGHVSWKGSWAVLRLDRAASKAWTIKALMHELKHVQQYYTKRLDWEYVPAVYDEITGKKRYNTGKWMQVWDGKLYSAYGSSRNTKMQKLYWKLPWEVDARAYEQEVERLFPNYRIPRQLVGISSDGTKFYKGSQ